MSRPALSVIVPSYNRRATLELVLEGLAQQSVPAGSFETIVVLDGSTDASAAMLAAWQDAERLPGLRWQRQPNSGQAAARNTGAELATAPLLLFLDDDVVPAPDLVATHLRWHATNESLAVLGDCRIVRERRASFYHLLVWAWWEEMYQTRAQPGRQPGCRDFCAGNVSLRRSDFARVGGFDANFAGYGGEDFDLGYRLLQQGVRFVADRAALAYHYHRTSVAGVLRATRQEGRADVTLGRKHPELRAGLRLANMPNGSYGLLVGIAMRAPALGDLAVALGQRALPFFERTQMRRRWHKLFDHLRGYVYWRGVRDALGSWRALRSYQAGAGPVPRNELDITYGLPEPLPPLWVEGPSEIVVSCAGRELGVLRFAGHLSGPLRPALARALAAQFGPLLLLADAATIERELFALEPREQMVGSTAFDA